MSKHTEGPWVVTYRNQGRPERTAPRKTYEEAHDTAAFLRFQGAKSVRIAKAEGGQQ